MKAVVPEKAFEGSQFFEIGLGQEPYTVLPAYRDPAGVIMTEWEPTPEERAAIAEGKNVLLWVCSFNTPLQPVSVEVAK